MNERRTIQRIGFRKWYEHELLRSHGHLVLLLLCALGLLGSLELLGTREERGSPWLAGACALVSAGIGLWALRRYLYLFGHAQSLADQAVCPACRTYARWDIEEEAAPSHAGTDRMRVRCRGCAHVWHIEL